MSLKIKLTIILFIIFSALALGVVGVYAVLDVDFVINGDIDYKVPIKDETQYSQFVFTYDTENFTASVAASSTDLSGEIEIPAKVMYENQVYTVNAISTSGFSATQITKVILPDTITTLNSSAFNNCQQLESVNLPSGITEIPNGCFQACINLKSIDLSYIQTIGVAAFINSGITDLVIPANVTTIYQYAFMVSGLKSLKILGNPTWANSNTSVTKGESCFDRCELLESVDLGESLTIIPKACFANCTSLKEVIISASMTSIDSKAFINCTSLTEITIPASVTSIGTQAFANCTALTKVNIKATPAIGIAQNAIPLNAGLQIVVPSNYLQGFKNMHGYYKNYFVAES